MKSAHPYEPLLPTHTILLDGDSAAEKREEIRAYFHKTYSIYEELHAILKDDAAFYLQPEKLRHPHIFYFGHTAAFYINKLVLAKLLDTPPAASTVEPGRGRTELAPCGRSAIPAN